MKQCDWGANVSEGIHEDKKSTAMSPDQDTFEQFINPLYKYINETTSRVPISDWHHTDSGKWVGFRARSVIGGYWMQVLMNKVMNNQ